MNSSYFAGFLTAATGLALVLFGIAGRNSMAAPPHNELDSERVSLSLVDTDVRDALRLVAEQIGTNIVASNQVTGRISLDLKNTSITETLDALASAGGLDYTVEGNLITVRTLQESAELTRRDFESLPPEEERVPAPMLAKVIRLSYLSVERVQPMLEKMLSESGSISMLKTADHVAQDRGAESDGAAANASSLRIGSRLETSSHGQPARSHTLLVHDRAKNVEEILAVVAQLDKKPAQIVIEARFVEISLDDDDAFGLDWNVLARVSGGAAPHTAPFGDSLGTFDPNVVDGSSGSVFPQAPNLISGAGEPGLFTFGTLDFTSFTALLELIQRQSRVQMVSNPRVVVGDRHTATILVGERFPILSANVSEFGTVTEQLDRYEPIGVQLAVTPSVVGDDEIQLLVRPSTSSLGGTVEGSTGLSVARINSRQIDTSVTVRDGQTVVLGGLITSRDVETESQVPVLGSIPLLGRLFSHQSSRHERVDLVIFLTVNIAGDQILTEAQRELFENTSTESHGNTKATSRSELEFSPSPPRY